MTRAFPRIVAIVKKLEPPSKRFEPSTRALTSTAGTVTMAVPNSANRYQSGFTLHTTSLESTLHSHCVPFSTRISDGPIIDGPKPPSNTYRPLLPGMEAAIAQKYQLNKNVKAKKATT